MLCKSQYYTDIPFSDSGLANSEKKCLADPALIQSHPNPFVPNTDPFVATSPSHCALASSSVAQSKHQMGKHRPRFPVWHECTKLCYKVCPTKAPLSLQNGNSTGRHGLLSVAGHRLQDHAAIKNPGCSNNICKNTRGLDF